MLFNSLRFGRLCLLAWVLSFNSVTAGPVKARFELMHLWITDEEQQAVAAFSTPMRNAGVAWLEHRHTTSFFDMQKEYAERVSLGYPATGVHWIGGSDMRQLVDHGLFRLIKDIPVKPSFKDILLPEVYEVVKYKGGITTLPVGIHLQNHMVYNREIFKQLGLDAPETWEELIDDLSRIKEAGYIPVTMSDQRWQIRFLFYSILSAKLTAKEIIEFVNQNKNAEQWRSQLMDALSILNKLKPFVNSDNRELNWAVSIEHLTSGKAAMSFMADFSSILYADDKRFVCNLPPGNNYVIWAFDSIALTKTSDPFEIKGQNAMIAVANSVDNLQRYVVRKGGIPVYQWQNLQGINRCSRQSIAKWEQVKDKIHIGSEWTQSLNIVAAIVQDFWRKNDGSIKQTTNEIINELNNLRNLSANNNTPGTT